MQHEIEIKIKFRYGHRLLPPYKGKCNNVHGEGGTLILIFESNKLDINDMVIDFGEAKKTIQKIIDDNLDHAYLFKTGDEVGEFLKSKRYKIFEMSKQPTAENIAKLVYGLTSLLYPQIKKVGCVESFDDSIAWYEKDKSIIESKILNFKVDKAVEELILI
jgi:6-pyruvoyl-tetrahydropterin synthase